VISYANSAKEKLLGVRAATLRRHGAVSHAVAQEMANGARHTLQSDYSLSLTGVSGPGGGTAQKPVGTLFVGISDKVRTNSVHRLILRSNGDRLQNRLFASFLALDMLRKLIQENQEKTKGKKNGYRTDLRTIQ
jgi:PncC family amidohydrolase